MSIPNILKPKWVILLTFISVTWINFNQERWKSKDVINHDVNSYYGYLPAVFLQKDLSLKFLDDTLNRQIEGRYYWPNTTPSGNHVFKMSMGMAASYLPFFGLAHIYAKLFNCPANGFSEPYHFAVLFSSLFYFLIGLSYLSKVLRNYFSETVTTVTLFCLSFGTNVLYYLTIGGGLAHTMGFSLIAIFLYFTIEWHKNKNNRNALGIALSGSWLTLIRPINILIFLFFFLYDVSSLKEMKRKINLVLSHKLQVLLIVCVGILFFLPQLFYWKHVAGSYFFNSYVGEHFFFNNPHLLDGLFSFRKGWLIYTPIMFVPLFGIYFLRETLKAFFVPTVIFLALYIYVVFSWWCWWYGGSFGCRALIDIYPILAIPFGAVLAKIETTIGIKKRISYALLFCFVVLNLFQTIQAKYNIIHFDSMTRENYFEVFFTTTKKPDREKHLKHPDINKALRGDDEY